MRLPLDTPDWVDEPLLLETCNGDWATYLERVYEVFTNHHQRPTYRIEGKPFRLKAHPITDGKEATFWHLISQGDVEAERIVDPKRCARLCWIRPMIEAVGTNRVKSWIQNRDGKLSYIICLPDFSFTIVIRDRGEYVLLWTAYCVEEQPRRQKLEKEYLNSVRL